MAISKRVVNKLQRVRNGIYFRLEELFYCLDLEKNIDIKKLPENIEYREGKISDIYQIQKENPQISGTKVTKFEERMKAGHRLWLFLLDGKIGTYAWHSDKVAPLAVGINIPLKKHQIFFYDFQTFPIARGKGLYGAAMYKSLEIALEQGKKEVFMTHLVDNYVSRKVFAKLGCKHTKTYINKRIFGKNYIKTTAV